MYKRLLLPLATAACVSVLAGEPERVFVERFDTETAEGWSLSSTLDPPGLRWHDGDERPGFHFKSVATEPYIKSHDYAWREWAVGTRAFDLTWEVRLDRALEQNWFFPGVAVAMTSAPAGEFGDEDIAVTIGVHMGGMAASVRKEGFYDLVTEGRGAYSTFRDRVLSRLIEGSSGGTASVRWPMKQPDDSRLLFRIQRTEDNRCLFTIRWPDLPGDRGEPYWTGAYEMPPEIAEIPLRYLCVKRMPVESVHVSYASFVMQGVVRNIQGRLADGPPRPDIHGFESDRPVLGEGVGLTLQGENFREGCTVSVGGKPATQVRVRNARAVTCRLPALEPNRWHPVTLRNPSGLVADMERGVPYGRLLETVRPREALPQGGATVTIAGAGFEKGTRFMIGGRPAKVLAVEDPRHVVVRVPQGNIGEARVEAWTDEDDFTGDPLFGYAHHPYLFYTAADVRRLRAKFHKPMFRHYRGLLLKNAERHASAEVGDGFNANVEAIMTLSFAYVLTDDEKYRDTLMQWVRRGWLSTQYTDFHLMRVTAMAVAYDILFAELTPNEIASFQDYLDRMLRGYLRDVRGSWFLGAGPNFSNTVPVGNSGGMLAGLALMYSTPDALEAVNLAAQRAARYPDECISPAGGCREGAQYWDFGLSFHLILAHALKNVTGDDRGLLDHPHLKNNVNFVRTQLGGNGGLFAFCDNREPWLGGYAVCADLGSRYNQPLMLWVADQAVAGRGNERLRGVWSPFAFLWRSETAAPKEFPGVPTLTWLKDMQWGAMRSDSSFEPRLVVGLKGSRGPLTHHKQNDLGSYVVHSRGEVMLVDPGYYEPKAEDHTLPVVDGAGPGVRGASITEAWEEGTWRYAVLDSTDAYGDAARQVRRHIVMHGENTVVVLDDILPARDKGGRVLTHYQTGWIPHMDEEPRKPEFTLTGEHSILRVRCFGPDVSLTARDREFRNGWHWKKISKIGPGDWHTVSGTYTAEPVRPFITVIQTVPKEDDLPAVPACSYDGDTVELRFARGAEVRFKQGQDRWHFMRP